MTLKTNGRNQRQSQALGFCFPLSVCRFFISLHKPINIFPRNPSFCHLNESKPRQNLSLVRRALHLHSSQHLGTLLAPWFNTLPIIAQLHVFHLKETTVTFCTRSHATTSIHHQLPQSRPLTVLTHTISTLLRH